MAKPTRLSTTASLLPHSAPEKTQDLTTTVQVAHDTPLWLCIYFPKLALEIFTGSNDTKPAAVILQTKGQYIIQTTSVSAERHGIRPKMTLSAARALYPTLQAHDANPIAQQNTLKKLAHWAQRFTAKVSIEPPQSLILEIQGSVKLFGGVDTLQQKIHQALQRRWHYTANTAVAPTTPASLLLAATGQHPMVNHKTELRSALGSIAIYALPINKKCKKQLNNIGVRTLRDAWRLPTANLARRFGPELTHYFDHLLGKTPDLRDSFHFPDPFMADNELPIEVRSTPLLLIAAQQLTEKLCRFLHNRDASITQCRFELYHGKNTVSTIDIGLRIAARDAQQILILLEEHLNRIKLTTSVTKLTLSAQQIQAYETTTGQLLFEPENKTLTQNHHIETLLEQLQARLGQHAIRHITAVFDHRPEKAHCYLTTGLHSSHNKTPDHNRTIQVQQPQQQLPIQSQQRPLWMLATPERLPQKNNQPWHQGPVTLLTGPERIECGWWSDNSIRRDYYLASDTQGRKLWIYLDLQDTAQWYLHGLFG